MLDRYCGSNTFYILYSLLYVYYISFIQLFFSAFKLWKQCKHVTFDLPIYSLISTLVTTYRATLRAFFPLRCTNLFTRQTKKKQEEELGDFERPVSRSGKSHQVELAASQLLLIQCPHPASRLLQLSLTYVSIPRRPRRRYQLRKLLGNNRGKRPGKSGVGQGKRKREDPKGEGCRFRKSGT